MGAIEHDLAAGTDEVRQTHISWVFLRGDDVLKVKKPVSLGFLDFSTQEARRVACEAEVAQNRRFSPDVYLGVVPVTRDERGVHRFGGAGETVDSAVHMRRLPDEDRLDQRLARGALDDAAIERLAVRIAELHEKSPTNDAIAAMGRPDAIAVNVRENFEQTRDTVRDHVSADEAAEIESWQLGVLEGERARFEARIASGRIRDGHGDLRLEQIYLSDEGDLHVLDCIEFAERFRWADVCADIAFLSMDLEFRGRTDLAERLLALYARESNDFDLFPLADFYESYRAYVRAKVSTLTAADERIPTAQRERAASEARRYYLLALAAKRPPVLPPRVIAIGGVIASGKSTLGDRLSAAIGAPVVETDRTRKHMVGARPTDKLYDGSWSGAYDPAFSERVYDELMRRGACVLDSGRPVVLDASFRGKGLRDRARRLASERGVPFTFVECLCPPDVCRARLVERARRGPSVSDGRLEIFDDFLVRWESPAEGELGPGEHVQVDTSGPLADSLRAVLAHLPTWDGLPG